MFLRLGFTAFGGPAAHVALMEEEFVRRRRWVRSDEFLDLVGATQLIPGPNSTEMAIHLGHRRAGAAGLVVAGAAFILPSMLLVGVLAWAYERYGGLPQMAGILRGVKPVIVAVIAQAFWNLGRTAIKNRLLAGVGIAAGGLAFLGVDQLLLLAVAGMVPVVASMPVKRGVQGRGLVMASALPLAGMGAPAGFGLWALFLFFLKVGSVLFGSGYVLFAFLHADLVEGMHWLTEGQLADAIAVGQVTPGPIFTSATFIGYVLGGPAGAVVATVGIFLPAFVFVALSGPLIPRIRASRVAGLFLDGVNAGSLALMGVVSWHLGRAALVDATTVGLCVLAGVLLLRFRVNSAWVVVGGGVLGLLV